MEVLLNLLSLDGEILLWIQEYLRSDLWTPFWKVVTTTGNAGILWIVLSVFLLAIKKTRKVGVMCACSLIFSLLFTNLLFKPLVARIRPYEVIAALEILVERPKEYSFPSGHASASFSVAWLMFRRLPKRYGISALVYAFFISFSRLYVGVHYPTDVLGGIVLGILYATIAVCIVEKISRRKQ